MDYYYVPTLSHLIALLLHPAPTFPKAGTSLIVIDSLSALIDTAYPRGSDGLASRKKNEHARWLAGRRQAVVSELATKLTRLAVMNNVAILVTNYATTKIRAGSRAVLRPALTGLDWEKALGAGIILLRGWWPNLDAHLHSDSDRQAARLAGVVGGWSGTANERNDVELAVEFVIEEVRRGSMDRFALADCSNKHGVREVVSSVEVQLATETSQSGRPIKRPFAAIVDSDGDESGNEYGWADDDQLAAEGLVDDIALVKAVLVDPTNNTKPIQSSPSPHP